MLLLERRTQTWGQPGVSGVELGLGCDTLPEASAGGTQHTFGDAWLQLRGRRGCWRTWHHRRGGAREGMGCLREVIRAGRTRRA